MKHTGLYSSSLKAYRGGSIWQLRILSRGTLISAGERFGNLHLKVNPLSAEAAYCLWEPTSWTVHTCENKNKQWRCWYKSPQNPEHIPQHCSAHEADAWRVAPRGRALAKTWTRPWTYSGRVGFAISMTTEIWMQKTQLFLPRVAACNFWCGFGGCKAENLYFAHCMHLYSFLHLFFLLSFVPQDLAWDHAAQKCALLSC